MTWDYEFIGLERWSYKDVDYIVGLHSLTISFEISEMCLACLPLIMPARIRTSDVLPSSGSHAQCIVASLFVT
jgi:hypothetical protein